MAKDKELEKEYKIERLRRTYLRKQKRIIKKGVPHKCESCGKQTGSRCFDPYYEDMYGIKKEVILCDSCYSASCGDI